MTFPSSSGFGGCKKQTKKSILHSECIAERMFLQDYFSGVSQQGLVLLAGLSLVGGHAVSLEPVTSIMHIGVSHGCLGEHAYWVTPCGSCGRSTLVVKMCHVMLRHDWRWCECMYDIFFHKKKKKKITYHTGKQAVDIMSEMKTELGPDIKKKNVSLLLLSYHYRHCFDDRAVLCSCWFHKK